MSDDFEDFDGFDEYDRAAQRHAGGESPSTGRGTTPTPRLVARLFAAASHPLRVRLLHCLIRPLGTLGIAGGSAGAFVVFVGREGRGDTALDAQAVAQVAHVTSQQVHELALFVEQVQPEALWQFASLASASPLAMATTFSAAALALLYRQLQPAIAPQLGATARVGPTST